MKGTVLASIFAAAGATVCCTGPFVLLLFGSTAVGMFSFLEPIRPYTSVLAIGLLGFAYFRTYRKRPQQQCCEIDEEKSMKKQRIQKRTLMGITPVVLGLVLFPYYSGLLYAGDTKDDTGKHGVVSEWAIEGMTCEGCAIGLQAGMASVKGVLSCKVDYETKSMVCSFDNKVLNPAVIESHVEKMGYRAIPKETKTLQKKAT